MIKDLKLMLNKIPIYHITSDRNKVIALSKVIYTDVINFFLNTFQWNNVLLIYFFASNIWYHERYLKTIERLKQENFCVHYKALDRSARLIDRQGKYTKNGFNVIILQSYFMVIGELRVNSLRTKGTSFQHMIETNWCIKIS